MSAATAAGDKWAGDYEMEGATKAVDGQVSELLVRALLVGSAGSSEGTLGAR